MKTKAHVIDVPEKVVQHYPKIRHNISYCSPVIAYICSNRKKGVWQRHVVTCQFRETSVRYRSKFTTGTEHAREQKGLLKMENTSEHAPQRLLLRIPEVMTMLGLGRTKIYQLIATGELPVVRVGRAVRISRAALDKWVEERQQQDSPF